MRKIHAASGNLLTDRWSWQGFVSSCDVFNRLFLLDVQSETELLTRLFCLIHGLFIALLVEKCTACQSHWKSDFGWHRFQNWAYSLALAWGVRELKSLKRFWNIWWLSEAASRLVSLSNYCLWCVFFFGFLKSSVWFMRLKLKHEQWSNYNSIRFKKPQIQRKGSEDYLVMILAVNRKLWAIFLPRVHLEKEQTPGSRLKT